MDQGIRHQLSWTWSVGAQPVFKFHNPFSLPVGVWHADATSLGNQIERNHSITCNAGLAEPKLKAKLSDLGGTVLGGPPADFGMILRRQPRNGRRWSNSR